MAKHSKTRGILVYNLLLKEISAINRNLPEDRKLTLKQRRELISKKLYPDYKGQAKYSIRLTPLREKIFKKIQRLPRRKGCNVLAIPLEVCQDIPYYEIEEFIRQKMPDCIYIMINGDGFGQTKIFNTRDFNYYSNGVAEITNRINEHVQKKAAKRMISPGQRYFGEIQTLPGKANNGNPDNYYLEMVLRGEDVVHEKEKRPIKPPRIKKTKTQRKKEKNIRQYVMERIKLLKQEKSRIKMIRWRIEKSIHETKLGLKGFNKVEREKILRQRYDLQKKKIDQFYNDNSINERQYNSLLERIRKGFGQKD